MCESRTNGTVSHSIQADNTDQPDELNGGINQAQEEIQTPEENVIEPPISERTIMPELPEMSAKGSFKDLQTLSKFRDEQVKLERKEKKKVAPKKKREKKAGSQVMNEILALQASKAMTRSMNPVFVVPPTITKLDTLFDQLRKAYE